MKNKLSFAIEDARLVDENPNSSFAILDLDFFASGMNLHDTFVSPETLMRTSASIKNVPLVWMYDPMTDDIFTHNDNQVPCGFVPESSEIKSRILTDGRTMLSTAAYVWKKYSGDFLSFFKRDGGEKPVSVEMSVIEAKDMENGIIEIKDYRFEAITVLGSLVSPAIPDAKARVMTYSKEYKDDFNREFSLSKYESVDFTIPQEVKNTVKRALSKDEKVKKATSIVLSVARHLLNSEKVSPEKVRYIAKHISKKSSNPDVFAFLGGKSAVAWSAELAEKMQTIDFDTVSYYSTEKEEVHVGETSPAEKPIGLEVMDKNITDKGETLMEKELEKKEEMAEVPAEEVKKEEMAEKPAESDEPDEDDKEEKKEFAEVDFQKFRSFFSDEAMSAEVEKFEKGMFADASPLVCAMYAKMCNMAKEVEFCNEKMAELVAYKAQKEESEKAFAVNMTIKKLEEKVVIPEEARLEMVEEAKKFATIEEFEVYAKAKSFDFALVTKKESDKNVLRVEIPRSGTGLFGSVNKDDVWSSTN